MNRSRALAGWTLPLIVLFLLYRNSFDIWFREDDFPLVDFMRRVHSVREFFAVAFIPYAQGTIRPWSERLPFFASLRLFGLDCHPLRILVFATACGDLLLINWITRRMTGSRVAGFIAPTLWAVSAAIVSPMTWNSSYNEVQYPLFLLGALALFIRYTETGAWRLWWLQFLVFVLGFGSLENIVVYPAVVVIWCLCFGERGNRKRLLSVTIPLFVVSLVFMAIHLRIATLPTDGPYEFRIDWRIVKALAEYSQWAILSPGWVQLGYPMSLGRSILDVTLLALALCIATLILKRSRAVWFSLGWFAVTLSLLLPLPNRHIEYYLAVPEIGLCMLAASGIGIAWRANRKWRTTALVAAAIWCIGMIPVVMGKTALYVQESRLSRALVLDALSARNSHPGKVILLDGITDQMYRLDLYENGMEAVGVNGIYLTSESGANIHTGPDDGMVPRLIPDSAVVQHALAIHQASVYRWKDEHLEDITTDYASEHATHEEAMPRRVRVGDPLYAYLLGKDWGGIGNGVRWMPAEAEVRIAGPDSRGDHISLTGYCLEEQLKKGALHITVLADGIQLGTAEITGEETEFHRRFPLPDELVHRKAMVLRIVISPPLVIGAQSFGALFGDIAIEP